MGSYLLIESRDAFECTDAQHLYELADGLAEHADEVTVFLVQNGVFPARRASAAGTRMARLAQHSNILVDAFSLRERGIRDDELAEGITPVDIDRLLELLLEDGRKVIWH